MPSFDISLLNSYQTLISRIIRETMLLNDPEGYDGRYPGRKRIKRAQLKAHGTWQEIHMDGHEKLGAQALEMGGIGFPIYGMKDKWGTGILYLSVVPDDRHSDVIGHVFLDFVELYGAIPQQVTTDKGSETGHIYGFMTGLKSTYAPNIDLTRYPCHVAVKSTNNTPIEGLWRWFRDQCGKNLHLHITKGRDEGIFNPNNPIHRNKLMPSGVSPNELHAHPEHYAGRCFAIPVPEDAILALRDSIKISREAALRWVPDEFDIMARQVYEGLGSPVASAETAWELFSQMAAIMH
ncbi:hypothetical protein GGX14DRAFT_534841 [Mycena pura]|uniref:Integrase core domain-containing protein n=1 Tax=Mycena pura TaxID=153505 RepID=A0AAD6VEB0_9AGAR|nr:hypothetical protein GGX14DRAFT_534841 [Mycena pura]